MAELILYDAANSPCARRVRMCLIEKGVPFEIRWMGLGLMDQKQAWYLKLNPNGLVPTLVHGERALYESNVINEYLDATFPEGYVPAGADAHVDGVRARLGEAVPGRDLRDHE